MHSTKSSDSSVYDEIRCLIDGYSEVEDEWKTRKKGNARIYVHPRLSRAIVSNFLGVFYDGQKFDSVEQAKEAAEEDFQ